MNSRISSFLLPRLQDVLYFAIFFLVTAIGQGMLNADGDLPRHLLAGQVIWESKSIPTTEPFIYPYAGRQYISHEWLSDVIFYLVNRSLGLTGIVLLAAILLAAAFTILYSYLSRRLNTRIPVILLVLWGTLAAIPNWITRPHLFSMLLLSIWLIMSDRLARGETNRLWQFPALMILWVNLHGEFIAGILVLIAYAAGWAWDYIFNRETIKMDAGKNLWLALIFSALASFVHPAGLQSWKTILGFLNNRYLTSIIIEAQSPNFQQPTFSLLLGFLLVSVILLSLKKDKLTAGQTFLLAGFTGMSLLAARNIHLYTIVAPFILAETVSGSNEIKSLTRFENAFSNIESQLRGVFWPVVTTFAFCIFHLSGSAQPYQFNPRVFPVDAVKWLESHPQDGNMFNDINWGGYIALNLWPQQPTFIDSIADFNGDVTKEYVSVMSLSEEWETIFEKYKIDWVIIRPNTPLAETLKQKWQTLYEDKTAIILHR